MTFRMSKICAKQKTWEIQNLPPLLSQVMDKDKNAHRNQPYSKGYLDLFEPRLYLCLQKAWVNI